MVSPSELAVLETSLLNKSGNVPLHNRFRALFTLKSLKGADAIRIISEGLAVSFSLYSRSRLIEYAGFQDESALLKNELAYCLGQMKDPSALPVLGTILENTSEDPMVRHEVNHHSTQIGILY
jgi:deoxyhypusine monooxygenase